MKMRNVFVISQHGYGIGHLTRSCAIADRLAEYSGITAYLFSGGRPSRGIGVPRKAFFVQLPPTEFLTLTETNTICTRAVDANISAEEIEQERSSILLSYFRLLKPAAVIIEYYPFAPERFGTTLDALLDEISAMPSRPMVISSVRTFPTDPTNAGAGEVNRLFKKYFDLVLHHTHYDVYSHDDIGAYFHEATAGMPVLSTGFVSRNDNIEASTASQRDGLLFTVGGGRDGAVYMQQWIEAAIASGLHRRIKITAVCGPFMPDSAVSGLRDLQNDNITVLRSLTDEAMAQLMRSSKGIVCMGGYNTLNEALESRTPTLAFPRTNYHEQLTHVQTLSAKGLILSGADTGNRTEIANKLEELLEYRTHHSINFNGAANSARFIVEAIEQGAGR